MKIDNVQLATILAALRMCQHELAKGRMPYDDEIATNEGEFPALTSKEIDRLCEALNIDDDTNVNESVRHEHLAFIRNIAFMSKFGAEDDDVEELHDTVNSLVSEARTLLNQITGHISPNYD